MYDLPQGLFEELFEPIKNGFFITIVIMILLLVFMMLKHSKTPYVWLIIHFIFLSLSGYLFFEALNPVLNSEIPQSIIYVEVDILFTFSGVTWIISLICLLVGISRFQKQN